MSEALAKRGELGLAELLGRERPPAGLGQIVGPPVTLGEHLAGLDVVRLSFQQAPESLSSLRRPALGEVLIGPAQRVLLGHVAILTAPPLVLPAVTMSTAAGARAAAVAATGQEIAALTSFTTIFSTAGLHFMSAYDAGHMSPSSRFAESWNPRVE